MRKLTYYIDRGNGVYEPFYEYSAPYIEVDEIYARQLCTYFIKDGKQYQLMSNEMQGDEEILVLKELGENPSFPDEENYRGRGLFIEFRRYKKEENYRRLYVIRCETHFDIIRYLLKDVVEIPGLGQMVTTSTEIDEDRAVYVIYVRHAYEDDEE